MRAPPEGLFGRAVRPVEAGREGDESNGVVVFPGVFREAIIEALRLDLVGDPGNCGGTLRRPQCILSSYPKIEVNGRSSRAQDPARLGAIRAVARQGRAAARISPKRAG